VKHQNYLPNSTVSCCITPQKTWTFRCLSYPQSPHSQLTVVPAKYFWWVTVRQPNEQAHRSTSNTVMASGTKELLERWCALPLWKVISHGQVVCSATVKGQLTWTGGVHCQCEMSAHMDESSLTFWPYYIFINTRSLFSACIILVKYL